MNEEVTLDQTREYLHHIISNLDGYTISLLCEYMDIYDDDILEYFEQTIENNK